MAARNARNSGPESVTEAMADLDTKVAEVMTDRELNRASGGEVEKASVPNKFSTEDYAAIGSFDDAIALASGVYGDILSAEDVPEFSDGFRVATEQDKRNMVGVPLFLVDWKFLDSDYGVEGDKFVVIHAVTRNDDGGVTKWVITDGSTGIARDLRNFTEKTGRDGGMLFKGGLSISEYQTDNTDGPGRGTPLSKAQVRQYMIERKAMAPAHTFYLQP
jgi:hypothetical protein